MKLMDLIRRFRVLVKDTAQPYFWADADVTDWLNDAEAQAAIRGRLLREDADPSVCEIVLTPGQHTYPLHPSVFEIIILRLVPTNGRTREMKLVSREWLDAEHRGWRDETRPMCFAIQNDTSLRVVGGIEAGDKLVLECYRLPMELMSNPNSEPEIHGAHHEHLIDWALHKAFRVPDAETFDPLRSGLAEKAFTAYFGLLPDSDMRRITREDVVHHNRAEYLL